MSVESVDALRARAPQVVHFLSHEGRVPIAETRQLLDNAVRDGARRTPVQQHQLDYCGYRTSQYSSCVYSMIILSEAATAVD